VNVIDLGPYVNAMIQRANKKPAWAHTVREQRAFRFRFFYNKNAALVAKLNGVS
jgi:hypothetical protein